MSEPISPNPPVSPNVERTEICNICRVQTTRWGFLLAPDPEKGGSTIVSNILEPGVLRVESAAQRTCPVCWDAIQDYIRRLVDAQRELRPV